MKKAWASRTSRKGFTIVELVVVVVVIGILATLVSITYTKVQGGVRDSQRTKDATAMKAALEKYHADNSQYPAVCSADNSGCAVSNLQSALQPYMDTVPNDPSAAAGSSGDYRYVRGAPSTDSYAILIYYENSAACKTGKYVNTAWWGTGYAICSNF